MCCVCVFKFVYVMFTCHYCYYEYVNYMKLKKGFSPQILICTATFHFQVIVQVILTHLNKTHFKGNSFFE